MDLAIEEKARYTLVTVDGRMDSDTSGAVWSACKDKTQTKPLLFDCERLSFVGSAGLTTLLRLARLTQDRTGTQLALCNVSGKFAELLSITGLVGFFRIIPDQDAF